MSQAPNLIHRRIISSKFLKAAERDNIMDPNIEQLIDEWAVLEV
jgi:hypothetical protein